MMNQFEQPVMAHDTATGSTRRNQIIHKRPHRKVRTGCVECKSRKVKVCVAYIINAHESGIGDRAQFENNRVLTPKSVMKEGRSALYARDTQHLVYTQP